MLFGPLKTVDERIAYENGQREGWGGGRGLPPIDRALMQRHYETAMECFLLDTDFAALGDPLKPGRYTEDQYRALAENNQALLFDIPSDGTTISFFPKWGLTKAGEINGVAVEVAKLFASYRAGEEGANFVRFVKNTYVTISTAEIGNKYLRQLFEGHTKGPSGWTMSLEDVFAHVSQLNTLNGRSVIAQVKAKIDCTELPLTWPVPKDRLLDTKPVWRNRA
ncbi:MAG: hypothetical protein EBQ96_08970 [Proteobacteria bacterium]|nr:hypothetical protein [Pseudomonadota bacterium]